MIIPEVILSFYGVIVEGALHMHDVGGDQLVRWCLLGFSTLVIFFPFLCVII